MLCRWNSFNCDLELFLLVILCFCYEYPIKVFSFLFVYIVGHMKRLLVSILDMFACYLSEFPIAPVTRFPRTFSQPSLICIELAQFLCVQIFIFR